MFMACTRTINVDISSVCEIGSLNIILVSCLIVRIDEGCAREICQDEDNIYIWNVIE